MHLFEEILSVSLFSLVLIALSWILNSFSWVLIADYYYYPGLSYVISKKTTRV